MAVNRPRIVWLGATPDRVQQAIAAGSFDGVLTPTRQAARAIGVPRQSLETLVDRLRLGGRVAPVVERQRALRSAVAQVWPGVDAATHASTIAPALREMLQNGLDLAAVAASAAVGDRARRLAQTALAYRRALGDRIDPAEQWWSAVRSLDDRPIAPLTLGLWGYGQLGLDAIALLDRLAGPGSVVWLPDHPALAGAIAQFQHRGWAINPRQTADPVPCPTQRAIAFATLEDEVRWVLAKVKTHLNANIPANQIVLVTRDERRYGPKLLEIAREFEMPVRLLYGVPLTETRVGDWAQTLLDAVQQNWDYESTVRLLRHGVVRDRLDQHWEAVRRFRPDRRRAWEQLGVELADLAPPVKSARATATRDQWVSWVQGCARSLEIRPIAQHWPIEATAFSRLHEQIVDLARPSDEKLTLGDFSQELRELLGLITVPMHPGRGGVELHNPASLLGASYQYGFALGVAETWWPAPIAPDLALDWFDRRDLTAAGFPMAGTADRANQERLHSSAALDTIRDTLILSYPRWHGQQPQAPSAILATAAIEWVEPEPVCLASPIASWRHYLAQADRPAELQTNPLRQPLERAWQMELQRLTAAPIASPFNGELGEFGAMDPDRHIFSASQITDLGQCPFKYFARRVLRLHEPSETEADLPHNRKGTLYHRVLQKLGDAQRDRDHLDQDPNLDPDHLVASLDRWITEAAEELQLPRYLTWTAQRQELLAQLQWLVKQDNFLPSGREILHCEVDFTSEWQGLKVRGSIDRVDRSPDGLVFIDYKTGEPKGAKAKNATGEAKLDVQLLVYASAAEQLAPDLPVADAYYYSIREGDRSKAEHLPRPDDPQISALVDRLRQHLETGSYPVDPDRHYEACNFCEAGAACRCPQERSRESTTAAIPIDPAIDSSTRA